MDSLTQVALGAAVGEAALGKKVGNRAILWGAVGGTLPDLDVILRFWLDQPDYVLAHRGFMHSITFFVLVAPVFGYGLARLYRPLGVPWWKWTNLMFWALLTHPLLDLCTTYGTGLFEPFSGARPELNTISIVDPLYTLPLLGFTIAGLFIKRTSSKRHWMNRLALGLSMSYLVFTFGHKLYVEHVFTEAFAEQGLTAEHHFTMPTLLNNILWMGVFETEADFWRGFYSPFDTQPIRFERWPKNHELLAPYLHQPDVQKFQRFSKGFFTVYDADSLLIMNDLRFGQGEMVSGPFIFIYAFRKQADGTHLIFEPNPPTPAARIPNFGPFWNRIWGN